MAPTPTVDVVCADAVAPGCDAWGFWPGDFPLGFPALVLAIGAFVFFAYRYRAIRREQ